MAAITTGTVTKPPLENTTSGRSFFKIFFASKNPLITLNGFTEEKPVLLVIGGSLGSVAINNAIRSNIDALLEKYQIIHLCGRNNLDESLEGRKGYKQFEYVKDELKHYFACANVVVSLILKRFSI